MQIFTQIKYRLNSITELCIKKWIFNIIYIRKFLSANVFCNLWFTQLKLCRYLQKFYLISLQNHVTNEQLFLKILHFIGNIYRGWFTQLKNFFVVLIDRSIKFTLQFKHWIKKYYYLISFKIPYENKSMKIFRILKYRLKFTI